MKKGDLSMGVIIGAAVALLILVLLSVLLFRAMNNVEQGTQCYSMNEAAECIPEGDSCSDLNSGGTRYIYHAAGRCESDMKCCIPLGG